MSTDYDIECSQWESADYHSCLAVQQTSRDLPLQVAPMNRSGDRTKTITSPASQAQNSPHDQASFWNI